FSFFGTAQGAGQGSTELTPAVSRFLVWDARTPPFPPLVRSHARKRPGADRFKNADTLAAREVRGIISTASCAILFPPETDVNESRTLQVRAMKQFAIVGGVTNTSGQAPRLQCGIDSFAGSAAGLADPNVNCAI